MTFVLWPIPLSRTAASSASSGRLLLGIISRLSVSILLLSQYLAARPLTTPHDLRLRVCAYLRTDLLTMTYSYTV